MVLGGESGEGGEAEDGVFLEVFGLGADVDIEFLSVVWQADATFGEDFIEVRVWVCVCVAGVEVGLQCLDPEGFGQAGVAGVLVGEDVLLVECGRGGLASFAGMWRRFSALSGDYQAWPASGMRACPRGVSAGRFSSGGSWAGKAENRKTGYS